MKYTLGGALAAWRGFRASRWAKEAHTMLGLSMPVAATFLFPFISRMAGPLFAARIGAEEMAAIALSSTYINITGRIVAVGALTASDTLLAQANGAKNFRRMGRVLLTSLCLMTALMVPVSVLWAFTEPLMLAAHQNARVSQLAGLYTRYMLPSLPFILYGITAKRMLQSMGIVRPPFLVSMLAAVVQVPLAYTLMFHTHLGFLGAPISLCAAWSLEGAAHCAVLVLGGFLRTRWDGFHWHALREWREYVRLASAGVAAIASEWVFFELIAVGMGTLGPEYTDAHFVGVYVSSLTYTVPLSLGVASNTRVGNLLGAGKHEEARYAARVPFHLALGFACTVCVLLLGLNRHVAEAFTNDPAVLHYATRIIPLLAFFVVSDSVIAVAGGQIRALAWQKRGAKINLVAFWCIALPICSVLVFVLRLDVLGAWLGLTAGQLTQVAGLLYFLRRADWKVAAMEAQLRVGKAGDTAGDTTGDTTSDTASDDDGDVEMGYLLKKPVDTTSTAATAASTESVRFARLDEDVETM